MLNLKHHADVVGSVLIYRYRPQFPAAWPIYRKRSSFLISMWSSCPVVLARSAKPAGWLNIAHPIPPQTPYDLAVGGYGCSQVNGDLLARRTLPAQPFNLPDNDRGVLTSIIGPSAPRIPPP
jgi:hypothetical protein